MPTNNSAFCGCVTSVKLAVEGVDWIVGCEYSLSSQQRAYEVKALDVTENGFAVPDLLLIIHPELLKENGQV